MSLFFLLLDDDSAVVQDSVVDVFVFASSFYLQMTQEDEADVGTDGTGDPKLGDLEGCVFSVCWVVVRERES